MGHPALTQKQQWRRASRQQHITWKGTQWAGRSPKVTQQGENAKQLPSCSWLSLKLSSVWSPRRLALYGLAWVWKAFHSEICSSPPPWLGARVKNSSLEEAWSIDIMQMPWAITFLSITGLTVPVKSLPWFWQFYLSCFVGVKIRVWVMPVWKHKR